MISVDQYISLIVPEHNSGILVPPLVPALGRIAVIEGYDAIAINGNFALPGTGQAAIVELSESVNVHGILDPSTALLHFDGPNGSRVTYADVYPPVAQSISPLSGTDALSTANFKFPPSSLLLDGITANNGAARIVASSGLFIPATADFTFECFGNANDVSGSRVLFGSQVLGIPFSGMVMFLNAGVITFLVANATNDNWAVALGGGSAIGTGVWHHYAWVRFGSTFTAYTDGIAQLSATYSGSIGPADAGGVGIGSALVSQASSPWSGYIDEVRITIGKARYTSNFTPPSAPFWG